MGKMAKEIGSLKSNFHEKDMKLHAVIPVEAVQIQLDTWWEWRTNVTVSSTFSGKAAAGRCVFIFALR